jgi:hypothetical protein
LGDVALEAGGEEGGEGFLVAEEEKGVAGGGGFGEGFLEVVGVEIETAAGFDFDGAIGEGAGEGAEVGEDFGFVEGEGGGDLERGEGGVCDEGGGGEVASVGGEGLEGVSFSEGGGEVGACEGAVEFVEVVSGLREGAQGL